MGLTSATGFNRDGFPVFEANLPAMLGINRDGLRNLRTKLTEGEDWILKKKRVRYSNAGVDRLRGLLNLPIPTPATATEADDVTADANVPVSKKTAPAANAAQPDGNAEVVTLHVWQTVKNPRILEAYLPGTDPKFRKNIVRVKVRDSKNFMRFVHEKPMELKARHLNADLYELATPCPRYRGRF
jgi:hypothetical protein